MINKQANLPKLGSKIAISWVCGKNIAIFQSVVKSAFHSEDAPFHDTHNLLCLFLAEETLLPRK